MFLLILLQDTSTYCTKRIPPATGLGLVCNRAGPFSLGEMFILHILREKHISIQGIRVRIDKRINRAVL